MSAPRPAVFLDRDGVLNDEQPHSPRTPEQWRWLPGAREGMARLAQAGLALVVITNQSAIARGTCRAEDLAAIHDRLRREASEAGAAVAGIYFCPHDEPDACACRKPKPGMLTRAAAELGLDLARSFLVGDAARDLQAARAAGVRPVLVLTGKGAALPRDERPDLVADDLPAAAEAILAARAETDR